MLSRHTTTAIYLSLSISLSASLFLSLSISIYLSISISIDGRVRRGEVVHGGGAGVVVASRDPALPVGAHVASAALGWREYATLPAAACHALWAAGDTPEARVANGEEEEDMANGTVHYGMRRHNTERGTPPARTPARGRGVRGGGDG